MTQSQVIQCADCGNTETHTCQNGRVVVFGNNTRTGTLAAIKTTQNATCLGCGDQLHYKEPKASRRFNCMWRQFEDARGTVRQYDKNGTRRVTVPTSADMAAFATWLGGNSLRIDFSGQDAEDYARALAATNKASATPPPPPPPPTPQPTAYLPPQPQSIITTPTTTAPPTPPAPQPEPAHDPLTMTQRSDETEYQFRQRRQKALKAQKRTMDAAAAHV